MTTFGLNQSDSLETVIDAVNYALANLGQGLDGVVANPQTGVVSTAYDANNIIAYLYQYLSVRYATNSTGTENFSEFPTNATYYGLQNSNSPVGLPTGSSNPIDYSWYSAGPGGFGTTKNLFYNVLGGRTIVFQIAVTAPDPFIASIPGVAINLDSVTSTTTAVYAETAGTAATANTANTANIANTSIVSDSSDTAITVTGNAQGNITSVGTLTGLTVAGNVSAGFYSGNGSKLANITAANVTGTVGAALLCANVVGNTQTAITTVGNLTNLSVVGNVTSGNTYNLGSWKISLTPTNGLMFNYAGANRMVLNTNGNVIISGTLTQSGTPL